jgi:hypothetical protein
LLECAHHLANVLLPLATADWCAFYSPSASSPLSSQSRTLLRNVSLQAPDSEQLLFRFEWKISLHEWSSIRAQLDYSRHCILPYVDMFCNRLLQSEMISENLSGIRHVLMQLLTQHSPSSSTSSSSSPYSSSLIWKSYAVSESPDFLFDWLDWELLHLYLYININIFWVSGSLYWSYAVVNFRNPKTHWQLHWIYLHLCSRSDLNWVAKITRLFRLL